MNTNLIRGALALALAAGSAAALAAPVDLKLTGWAIGGNTVSVSGYTGGVSAGGFTGSLSNAGGFDSNPFLTYCIELSQNFSFSGNLMPGYEIVAGADYFGSRHNNAAKAERLGLLWTYVANHAGAVDTATESTGMQLAIWNIVYDNDNTLTHAAGVSSFSDKSANTAFRDHANFLLAQSLTVGTSQYNVFALESATTQDFLLTSLRPTGPQANGNVPEPASLALVVLALVGAGAATRRRGAKAA